MRRSAFEEIRLAIELCSSTSIGRESHRRDHRTDECKMTIMHNNLWMTILSKFRGRMVEIWQERRFSKG